MSPTGTQQGQQTRGEREMTKVVGPELQLVTVFRGVPDRGRHHSRVVDQEVDRSAFRGQPVGEAFDRHQRSQVQDASGDLRSRHVRTDALESVGSFGRVAYRENQFGTGAGEPFSQPETDAVARPGHHGKLSS